MSSPPLELKDEVRWPILWESFAAHVARTQNAAVGSHLVGMINKVVADLGSHFAGPSKHKKAEGNVTAFKDLFEKMEQTIPKPASAVVL